MKTKLLLLTLLCPLLCGAAETEVTPSTLSDAYTSAADGDVLVLTEGTYTGTLSFPSGKTITLKAANGATVLFGNVIRNNTQSDTNGGLIFDGLDIKPSDNYFISTAYGNYKLIEFKNCTIESVGRCLINNSASTGNIIESFIFQNTIIKNCGANGYSLLYPTRYQIKNFTVQNCTLYNYASENFLWPRYASSGAINVTFKNNTVYKWSKKSSYALINMDSNTDAGSTFLFENNIIYKSYVSGMTPKLLSAKNGTLTAKNNLIVEYGDYNLSTPTNPSSISDLTLEGLGISGITFPDPDNGDFTIVSSSPLATAGTGGTCLGDPRWIKTIANAVHLTTAVAPEGSGSVSPKTADYSSGDKVTLTATSNYGYRFKQWQDSKGNVLSSNNPYTFTITTDTTVTAAFNTVDSYTLTVNTAGEGAKWGKVTLSPEPINGIYETGTEVTMKVIPNTVTSFLNWDDGSSATTRVVNMDANKTCTATFDVVPFIVAWDFASAEPRGTRPADYAATTDNAGTLYLYNGDGTSTNWGGGNKTFGGTARNCIRRYTDYSAMSNPRSFVAKFLVNGYTNVKIHSYAGWDNTCVHKIQKMQYSLDGTTYTDLTTLDLGDATTANEWKTFDATLTSDIIAAAGTSPIYIRWIGDTSSALLGTPGSTDTEGFYLADIAVFADNASTADHEAPLLVSTSPSEGSTSASATGNIVLFFNEKVQAGTGDITLNGKAVTPIFGSKTATINYNSIGYGTPCTLVIPQGALTDRNGNVYAGSTLTFTTMQRPQPTKRIFDAVVASDGTGDYTSVQAAINAAPIQKSTPYLIFVKNGEYDELVRINDNKPFIHLIGQDKEKTIIKFKLNNGDSNSGDAFKYSTNNPSSASYGYSGVMEVNASDFYTENITYLNTWGVEQQAGPMDLAMKSNNDRQAFYNCKFRGYQDTWQTTTRNISDRHYVKNCFIEGAVDYFYGAGDVFIDSCTFYNVRSGSVITAPCHKAGTAWGYIFNNCIVDGNEAANDGKQALGRPWQNNPIARYLNCTMKIKIKPEGWSDMGECSKVYFQEYNSMDAEGNALDLSNRKSQYYRNNVLQGTCPNPVLTAEQAAQYTYENVMSGSDNWNPRKLMEAVDAPASLTYDATSKSLSWATSSYAICYIVIDSNDKVTSITTDTKYDASASTSTQFSVKAVNEYGSLSRASVVSTTTGISAPKASDVVSTQYFTPAGIQTNSTTEGGVYIMRQTMGDGSHKVKKVKR